MGDYTCNICYETVLTKNMIILRCNHCLCKICYKKLVYSKCPFCRQKIGKIISKTDSNSDNDIENTSEYIVFRMQRNRIRENRRYSTNVSTITEINDVINNITIATTTTTTTEIEYTSQQQSNNNETERHGENNINSSAIVVPDVEPVTLGVELVYRGVRSDVELVSPDLETNMFRSDLHTENTGDRRNQGGDRGRYREYRDKIRFFIWNCINGR